METKVRRTLEIPARKREKVVTDENSAANRSFLLVINLWFFRYEYAKETHRKEGRS